MMSYELLIEMFDLQKKAKKYEEELHRLRSEDPPNKNRIRMMERFLYAGRKKIREIEGQLS